MSPTGDPDQRGAPAPVGPYSQAIVAGDLVFCSGQVGLDPATGELVDGSRSAGGPGAAQSVGGAGRRRCQLADVVKTTIFLADVGDFAAVNAIYGQVVPDPPPARSTVGVAACRRVRLVESRGDRPPFGRGRRLPRLEPHRRILQAPSSQAAGTEASGATLWTLLPRQPYDRAHLR
jgi:2-iminobutanoate/2-iminopropanoate deaminase